MARQWAKFEEDVKKLIKKLTNFKAREDNFGLCLQFAQSNLVYHQFPTVNSHTVTRALDGISEKFAIHSDEKKATAFKRLTGQFLDSEDFECHDQGRTDTHYALLSILLNLANNPTQAQYEERRERKKDGSDDVFDWKSFLLEGEDLDYGCFPESPEWSSEDEDEVPYKGSPARPVGKSQQGASSRVLKTLPRDLIGLVSTDQHGRVDSGRTWLDQNLMVQYWEGQGHTDLSYSREATLSSDWEAHLTCRNPLYEPAQRQTLSEYQVMREVLWMISGNKDTFVFQWDGAMYHVRPELQVAHLTQEALYNLLQDTTRYGNITLKLSNFIETVTSKLCRYDDSGKADTTTCQTYHAFASVLSKVIQEFKDEVLKIQVEVTQQETPATLMQVVNKLSPWLPHLLLLDKVYEKGVVAVRHHGNAIRAQHLLSILYGSLLEMDTLGQDVGLVSLLLRVWAQSSRPYWDIIDRWIFLGNLSDPYKELLVQRNETVKTLDEHFWDMAFTLQLPRSGEMCSRSDKPKAQGHLLEQGGSSKMVSAKELTPQALQGHIIVDLDLSKGTASTWAPQFIQPVLQQVVLAGKSMEMLQALARLGNIIDDDLKEGERKTLYETFIETLQKHLGQAEKPGLTERDETGDSRSRSNPSPKQLFMTHIDQQMHVKGTYDPLLQQNFATIFNPISFQAEPLTQREDRMELELRGLNLDRLLPIRELLETCLHSHILERYQQVCTHLLDILKDRYNLLDHFAAMRNFYLLEAGDTMHEFYTELFEKLRLHEAWQDVSFLNTCLQGALSAQFPSYVDRVFVSVESGDDGEGDRVEKIRPRDRQPINALDDLRLHYKVPWPVSVVIHSRSIRTYNTVFSFLLQIKRSKYALDQLRFIDLERQTDSSTGSQKGAQRQSRIHRMQLFRMKLMHFVNSLHLHIMTRIIHSTGLEFQQALEGAADLDEVITHHTTYITTLHRRCLLHHSVRCFRYAITKVMTLALAFTECWEEGVDNVSEKQLGGMESEFGNSIQFLSTFLNNIIKRGTHPHLESLTYTLLSSGEQDKPVS